MPYISVARPETPRPATARLLWGPQPTNLQWAEVPRKYHKLLLYIFFSRRSRRSRHQKGLDGGHFLWQFRKVNALWELALILEPLFLA